MRAQFSSRIRSHDRSSEAFSGGFGRLSYGEALHTVDLIGAITQQVTSQGSHGATSAVVAVLSDEGFLSPLVELSVAIGGFGNGDRSTATSESGVQTTNSIFVPLDPTFPKQRLEYQLRDSGATILFADASSRYFDDHQELLRGLVEDESSSVTAAITLHFQAQGSGGDASRCGSSEIDGQEDLLWISKTSSDEDFESGLLAIDTSRTIINENGAKTKCSRHVQEFFSSLSLVKANAEYVKSITQRKELGNTITAGRNDCLNSVRDALYLIYTSGTTGAPKAVVGCSHALWTYLTKSECLHRKEGDRVLLCSATTWDPSVSDIFGTLLGGGTVILEPRAKLITDLVGCIRRNEVTHILSTPALWKLIDAGLGEVSEESDKTGPGSLRVPDSAERSAKTVSIPSLQMLLLGGEKWTPTELVIPSSLKRLHNIYGVTEATVYQALSRNLLAHEGSDTADGGVVLYPLHDDIFFRIEPESGELLIGGPQVLRYHNRRELNEEKFFRVSHGDHEEMYFRSGDVATVAKEQNTTGPADSQQVSSFHLAGRSDRQVKIRGFRIELDELEVILANAPMVNSAVCEKVNEKIVAFVKRKTSEKTAGLKTDDDNKLVPWSSAAFALRHYCAKRMPAFQIPWRFIMLDPKADLPLTATGKIDRKKIVDDWVADPSVPSVECQSKPQADSDILNKLEILVAEAWREIFKSAGGASEPMLSPSSDFWEMGGTSALAVQVVRGILRKLELKDSDAGEAHKILCALINFPELREFSTWLEKHLERISALKQPDVKRETPEQPSESNVAEGNDEPEDDENLAQDQNPVVDQKAARKKKPRRKRRDLQSGLMRHTRRMLDTWVSGSAPGATAAKASQTSFSATGPGSGTTDANANKSSQSLASGSTERSVYQEANAVGDVLVCRTLLVD